MPTFKEKCPEFGQKILIYNSIGFYCGNDKRAEMYKYKVRFKEYDDWFMGIDQWTPISEEPQWTQITEDSSTWPPVAKTVVLSDDAYESSYYHRLSDIGNGVLGKYWTHMPKRKKEEAYFSDKSIDILKKAETEARLWKLERKADELESTVKFLNERIIKSDCKLEDISHVVEKFKPQKESSPWKCAINNPPPFGKLVFVRMKQNNGEFGYCISGRYDILRWHHDPLNRENGFKDEEDFIGEWMEIPK